MIVVLNPTVAAFGVGWLSLGMVVYLLFRRQQGLDLTSTHKVAIPQPVVDHEAEYDSVLVPMGAEHYDESVVATAAKLAARRRRGIHILAMVTVPSALPIDAPMPEQEAAAQSIIEQARVQVGARVSGHVERVRSGQAGRRIIEEATDMRAAAIVMPLPQRVNGASLFGKTLETVLAERPCRVIIESAPAPESAQRARRSNGRRWRDDPDACCCRSLMVLIGVALIVRTLVEGVDGVAFGLDPRRPVHRDRSGAAVAERPAREPRCKRQLGSPALFGIVQGFIAASIYFSTGLVAERALGLTWAVFLAGARAVRGDRARATSRAPRCTRSAAARP